MTNCLNKIVPASVLRSEAVVPGIWMQRGLLEMLVSWQLHTARDMKQ